VFFANLSAHAFYAKDTRHFLCSIGEKVRSPKNAATHKSRKEEGAVKIAKIATSASKRRMPQTPPRLATASRTSDVERNGKKRHKKGNAQQPKVITIENTTFRPRTPPSPLQPLEFLPFNAKSNTEPHGNSESTEVHENIKKYQGFKLVKLGPSLPTTYGIQQYYPATSPKNYKPSVISAPPRKLIYTGKGHF
jgi:hypothetical protein